MSKRAFERILVGYDGSDNAQRALSRAIGLAKRSRGELRIVVVADSFSYSALASGGMYKTIDEQAREVGESLAGAALETAKTAGLANVYSSEEEGQPADIILSVATEYKADLIVVGRRGRRGITRFLMGSVSTAVINHANCDVLVVK